MSPKFRAESREPPSPGAGGPLISVVVPVYGVEEFLPRCLESILMQTYRDFEVILVDDGSPDQAGHICDSYAAKDERLTVIHTENRGVSAARNRALQAVRGSLVTFVDGDDFLQPRALQSMAERLAESGCDICVSDSYYRGEEVRYLPAAIRNRDWISSREALRLHLRFAFVSAVWVFMFTREALHGLEFNEEIHQLEDWEYLLRVLTNEQRIAIGHGALYHNTIRDGSASNTVVDEKMLSAFEVAAIARTHVGNRTADLRSLAADLDTRVLLKLLGTASRRGVASRSIDGLFARVSRRELLRALRTPHLPVRDKGYVSLASISPKLYYAFYQLRHGAPTRVPG